MGKHQIMDGILFWIYGAGLSRDAYYAHGQRTRAALMGMEKKALY